MKQLNDNSIDLIITSPPYADLRDYGDGMGKIKPDEYVNWFIPKAKEMLRILKLTGNFILNINDRVVDGERHTYVFELVLELKKLGFKFIDTYIWDKKNVAPPGNKKRCIDIFEYIFWFSKTLDYKFNMNEILRPYCESSLQRFNYKYSKSKDIPYVTKDKFIQANSKGAKPYNLLHISSCKKKDNIHTAVFPSELVEFFIKANSNENDLVLDPFIGSGTTGIISKQLNRNYIGFELDATYCNIAEERIQNMIS
jgi:DNA modification methylase